MSLSDIAAKIDQTLKAQPIEKSLKFDCGEDGAILLSGNSATLSDDDADCTLKLSQDNLVKLLTGKLNPMTAVALGKIKVKGDAMAAMKLAKLIG